MKPIRLATPSEVESIKDHSDLEQAVQVLAWDQENPSSSPDLAVVRRVWELDPVYFAPFSNARRKLEFSWCLESMLKLQGAPSYYFNIHASDVAYRDALLKLGSTQVSTAPELRFKRTL